MIADGDCSEQDRGRLGTSWVWWAQPSQLPTLQGSNVYVHLFVFFNNNKNNKNKNRRLVTLAEHTSDHGKQTNSSTKERGSRASKLLGANAKS